MVAKGKAGEHGGRGGLDRKPSGERQGGRTYERQGSGEKHAHAPRQPEVPTPYERNLELFIFVHSAIHLMLQTLNVYRSALYNINFDALLLCAMILARRLVSCQLRLWGEDAVRKKWVGGKRGLILATATACVVVLPAMRLFASLPWRRNRFLMYPVVAYLLAQRLPGFLGARAPRAPGPLSQSTSPSLIRQESRKGSREAAGTRAGEGGKGAGGAAGGVASGLVAEVRAQGAESSGAARAALCEAFAGMLLDVIVIGVVPLVLVQHDHFWFHPLHTSIVVGYTAINMGTLVLLRYATVRFASITLWLESMGHWRVATPEEAAAAGAGGGEWSEESVPYGRGAVVRHKGVPYAATTDVNVLEPGGVVSGILYALQSAPAVNPGANGNVGWLGYGLYDWVVGLQTMVVVLQLLMLVWGSYWKLYAAMLLLNYVLLYLCLEVRRGMLVRGGGRRGRG